MKEFLVIVAIGFGGVALGAFMALVTFAIDWHPWKQAEAEHDHVRVVVKLQDWRTK